MSGTRDGARAGTRALVDPSPRAPSRASVCRAGARLLAAVALLPAAALLVALPSALASGTAARAGSAAGGCCDWPEFGYDPARSDSGPASTGIDVGNVARLRRTQVELDGTVDSSPIYLHEVEVEGRVRDVVVVTTTYGRTEAIDASSGTVLWRFSPPGYGRFAGSGQITTASPAADPGRTALYAAAPDGVVRKLSLADGTVLWARSVTRDPTREKLASALTVSGGLVIATLGGYYGDIPPYQGGVVVLDARSGAILRVWNALCSQRRGLIAPASCPQSDAGIWARAGAVVVPGSGDLLVATGNGAFDGARDWGDSVLLLGPGASSLLGHWTPGDQAQLQAADRDLGSTAPALLAGGLAVQGGKDGLLRLLSLGHLAGADGATGGAVQTVQAPGGAEVYGAPAVWEGSWVFVATGAGTAAWRLAGGRLHQVWSNGVAGTSPVLAGGLLYVEASGDIAVYLPASGRRIAELPIGEVHWQSPIVADGRVIAAEGNANDHAETGVLDVYRLP